MQAVIPIEIPPPNQQSPPPPPQPMAVQIAPPIQCGSDLKWPKLPIFNRSYQSYLSWKNQFKLYMDEYPHHFSRCLKDNLTWMLSYISSSSSAIVWSDEKRR
jgi:hypothetical protein